MCARCHLPRVSPWLVCLTLYLGDPPWEGRPHFLGGGQPSTALQQCGALLEVLPRLPQAAARRPSQRKSEPTNTALMGHTPVSRSVRRAIENILQQKTEISIYNWTRLLSQFLPVSLRFLLVPNEHHHEHSARQGHTHLSIDLCSRSLEWYYIPCLLLCWIWFEAKQGRARMGDWCSVITKIPQHLSQD